MATQTNIYLTPEVADFAKNNPNSDIGSLLAFSASQAIELVVAALVLSGLFYFGMKTLAAANIGTQGESKKMLQKIAGGFVLLVIVLAVFSSQGALTFDFALKPLGSSPKAEQTLVDTVQRENDNTNAPPVVSADEAAMLSTMLAGEAEVRQILRAAQIETNELACKRIGQTVCTSVGGMSSQTVDMLVSLAKACQCSLVVTGGTEWWSHSKTTKHKPGNSTAVDLRDSRFTSSFIKNDSRFKNVLSPNLCYSKYTWSGFSFCDEIPTGKQPRHWHIQPL